MVQKSRYFFKGGNSLFTTAVLTAIFIITVTGNTNAAPKGWAAKVGKQVITIGEFNRFYYVQNRMVEGVETNAEVDRLAEDPVHSEMHPFLNKEYFLDTLINGMIVTSAAREDKSIDQDEMDALVELSRLQVVMQYYLTKKLQSGIVVTDDEVEEFYKTVKDKLTDRPLDEAKGLCRKHLYDAKLREEMQKYMDDLRLKTVVDKDGLKQYLLEQKK